ncbi:DUF4880 domain-containing protein [Pseudoalteromonas prydzensis]|uniref:DUF4880 domain-containing protein n=1 Tax=Pseudoalteromonas prydzensis TaxID=182141 RepID=A0ABR9FJN6_9GAMM|nr:DUF4880 domain-containing protein [Pseudoalteromonas prydzensis]MBE0457047.1 DUF4880 domain-containing protein [Pseudoalteromonas prydzensis]
MKETPDEIWRQAWQWAQYPVHEVAEDHPDLQRLQEWLKKDYKHKVAYEQACELWLVSGLVPPTKNK